MDFRWIRLGAGGRSPPFPRHSWAAPARRLCSHPIACSRHSALDVPLVDRTKQRSIARRNLSTVPSWISARPGACRRYSSSAKWRITCTRRWNWEDSVDFQEGTVRRCGVDRGRICSRPGQGSRLPAEAGAYRRRLRRRFGVGSGRARRRPEAQRRVRPAIRGRGAPRGREQCRRTVRRPRAEGWLHPLRHDLIEHNSQRHAGQARI